MKLRFIRRGGFALLFILTIVGLLGGCEPAADVKLSNLTGEPLKIYHGEHEDVYIGEIAHGVELKYITAGNLPYLTITAKDIDGNVVYWKRFTRAEVARMEYVMEIVVYPEPVGGFEPGLDIRVYNRGSELLTIYYDDIYVGQIKSAVELEFTTIGILPSYTITAIDVDGNIVYSKRFTREELAKMKYLIEIQPESIE